MSSTEAKEFSLAAILTVAAKPQGEYKMPFIDVDHVAEVKVLLTQVAGKEIDMGDWQDAVTAAREPLRKQLGNLEWEIIDITLCNQLGSFYEHAFNGVGSSPKCTLDSPKGWLKAVIQEFERILGARHMISPMPAEFAASYSEIQRGEEMCMER